MKIFSGSSNLSLAKEIAKKLNLKLAKIELSKFANNECRVWIKEKVANSRAIIVQSFSSPPDEHIMELCLIADALKRLGIKKIIAVIPWLGYCVQDKIFRTGEPLSSKVIAQIIQSFKINRIITLDLHNETTMGFFDIPLTNLSSNSIFVKFFDKKKKDIDWIISPDVGGLKKATKFAQALNLPIASINKKRDLASGKVSIISVSDKIKGKSVLIVDDFLSTGGTLIQTAKYLKKQGVKKVYAALTHHFYAKGVQKKIEKSDLDKLYVTNTIKPQNNNYKKLKVISAANLIAKEIKKSEKI